VKEALESDSEPRSTTGGYSKCIYKVVRGEGGRALEIGGEPRPKVLFRDEAFDRKDVGGLVGWSVQAVFQGIVCFKRWKSVSINPGG
jgi:hypothetical protein